MRDIDPKKIPVLDDIIEQDMAELENSARRENLTARPIDDLDNLDIDDLVQANSLDLFSAGQFSVDQDKPDDSLTEMDMGNFAAHKETDQSEELTDIDSTEISHQLEYRQSLNVFSSVSEHDLKMATSIEINTDETGSQEADSSISEDTVNDDENPHSEETDNIDLDDADLTSDAVSESAYDAASEMSGDILNETQWANNEEVTVDPDDDNKFESALISFVDEDDDNEILLSIPELNSPELNNNSDEDIHIDSDREDSLQQLNTEAVDNRIDNMVDTIVQQLLPDLELHLKSLVKQALDDNLTDAVKKSFYTDN